MFMHWFKKLSIITASFFAFSNAVYATDVNLSYGLTQGVYAVSRDAQVGSFSFEDTFNLNLQVPAYFSFSILEDKTDPAYDIVDGTLSYALYQGSSTTPVSFTNNTLFGTGLYKLLVTGTASGQFGGQYFLNINVSSAPVPEPDMNLVMLLGLTIVGLVSLRKSQAV